MSRHPSAIARDQRAMRQARTVGRRHGPASDDARDQAVIDDRDRRGARVVRWLSAQQHEVIAYTSVHDGIALAVKIGRRCVVVLENGKTVFDNHREY